MASSHLRDFDDAVHHYYDFGRKLYHNGNSSDTEKDRERENAIIAVNPVELGLNLYGCHI